METASILVCEDERLIARDIGDALERSGYIIAGIASDGDQALKIAQEKLPDLALMDIRLRGNMSGIEVAGMLVEKFGIPSIYLTAYADEDTLSHAKATQPLSYLLKPFNETELRTVVEVALHRYREQRHVVGALQDYIGEYCDPNAIEKAVEREREFLKVEQLNSQFRIAGNIAEQLNHHLSLFAAHVEPVARDRSLHQELRNMLRGALVHQDRAIQIIARLLECSDTALVSPEESPMDTIVRDSMAEASQRVGRAIDFVECFAPIRLVSTVDRTRVQEAIVNVMINAYQATKDEPLVIVSTSFIYEELPERYNPEAHPGWFNVVEITDFGKGIRNEQIEHIFEPCFTAADIPVNNGLGLSVAYTALQKHGGWISVKSAPNAGTTVSLFFPSAHAPEATDRDKRPALSGG